MRGQFITLEGSEGAGKSTNVDSVCATLDNAGIRYLRTREPGGTPMAEALRESMLHKWEEQVDALAELLLVFAARAQHLTNVIEPALDRGQWVVCDRFTDASFAYQGYGRQLDLEKLETLESWVHGSLQPDLSLYLDLEPDIAEARIAEREKDRMEEEQQAFFIRVREGYLARAKQFERIVTINAGQPLAAVQADVCTAINRFIEDSTLRAGRDV